MMSSVKCYGHELWSTRNR